MLNKKPTESNLNENDLNSLYEELREDALRISTNYYRKGQGFSLFIRKGMAGWVEAWTSLPSTYLPAAQQLEDHPPRNLPIDLHTEAAVLLTNMVWDVYQEIKTT